MVKLDSQTIISIVVFVGFVCSVLLTLAVVANNEVNDQKECDGGPVVSDDCALSQCFKGDIQDTFEIPHSVWTWNSAWSVIHLELMKK
jgi:hypothetical protein